MNEAAFLLETLWRGVALHLWQTTLVLGGLALLSLALRSAPARYHDRLWWIGLAKLFLPLALLAPVVEPLWRSIVAGGGAGRPVVELAAAVLRPANGWTTTVMGGNGSTLPLVLLTLAWLAGVGGLVWRWSRRGPQAAGRRVRTLEEIEPALRERVRRAIDGTTLDPAGLNFVDAGEMPCVSGLWRPRLVLPIRVVEALDTRELSAVLLHEEAHRLRRDPLRAALLRVALAIFFFYPPLWWLARRLRETAEHACDESVLAHGTPPAVYGRALARALSLGLAPARLPAAVGLGRPGGLRRRLARIERAGSLRGLLGHRMALGVAGVLLAVSLLPLGAGEGEPQPGLLELFPELAGVERLEAPVVLDFTDVGLGKVLEAIGKASGVELLVEGHLPVVRRVQLEEISAVEALARLGLEYGLTFERVDSRTLRIRPMHVAGVDGVTNPRMIKETMVQPTYPETARQARIEGDVILQAIILRSGSVGSLQVLRGVEEHPEFAEAAKEAVGQWRYEPATLDGKPVDVFFTVFVQFSLSEKGPRQ